MLWTPEVQKSLAAGTDDFLGRCASFALAFYNKNKIIIKMALCRLSSLEMPLKVLFFYFYFYLLNVFVGIFCLDSLNFINSLSRSFIHTLFIYLFLFFFQC